MNKEVITIYNLPPLLNVWQRMHWGKRMKINEEWVWLIKEQALKIRPKRAKITFTRVSVRMADYDGIGGSFKPVGDALVKCGVLKDDSPLYIDELVLKWKKSKSLKDQHVIIEIEDVSEGA